MAKVSSKPGTNRIEAYMRDHLRLAQALINGDEPHIGIPEIAQHVRELERAYGEEGRELIVKRTGVATRQIFGGEADPPLANLQRDGLTAVEACIAACDLVEQYRRRGVKLARDPEWFPNLQRAYGEMIDRYAERMTRAAEVRRMQRTARAPAAVPAPERTPTPTPEPTPAARAEPLQHVELPATVAPVETRAADPDDLDDGIPMRAFRFAWKEGKQYHRGNCVLDQGATWIAAEPNFDARPGTTGRWRLVAKGNLGPKKEQNYNAVVGAK